MFEVGRWQFTVLLALATVGPVSAAADQDLVAVAPELAKVEYEDARVRVVRLRIPAHTSVLAHDRRRRIVVSLTANYVRLTSPDGTASVTHRGRHGRVERAGRAQRVESWRCGREHRRRIESKRALPRT